MTRVMGNAIVSTIGHPVVPFPKPFTVKRRYRVGTRIELSYGWGYVRRWAGRVAHAHLLDLQRAGANRPSEPELAAWVENLIHEHGARYITHVDPFESVRESGRYWAERLKDEDIGAIAATAARYTLDRCAPDYIQRMQERGRRGGRPRVATTTDLLRCVGLSIRETAMRLGISTATVSRLRAAARARAILAAQRSGKEHPRTWSRSIDPMMFIISIALVDSNQHDHRDRTPGRPCSICSHPEREAIEAETLSGKPYRAISRAFGLGGHDSLRRHVRAHLGPEIAEQWTDSATASVALVDRLAEIGDDLRDARERAAEAGDTTALVRAATAEARVLLSVADRLGVDHESLNDDAASAAAVFRALAHAAKREPVAARAIEAGLRAVDAVALADELRQLTHIKEISR